MSEPIPESVPTSADPRSKRPTKRRVMTPSSAQASSVEALFAKPDREITVPGGPKPKTLAPPPEIVANVQGSSAGAGSGEFHVYKASRRREYERLRMMDDEVKREKGNEDFERQREEMKAKDDAKTSKNKARREKQKARKTKGKTEPAKGSDSSARAKANGVSGLPAAETITAESPASGAHLASTSDNPNPEEIGIIIHDD
ncbi:DUF1168-domain-containing protein, partial [Xylona heveae TC161]